MNDIFLLYQNDSNYKNFSYGDILGKLYCYDSFVPNHKKIKINDSVIFRLNKKVPGIVGHGLVSDITISNGIKERPRCPKCDSANLNQRSRLLPRWKCYDCLYEFDNVVIQKAKCIKYVAGISDFREFKTYPTIHSIKRCSYKSPSNQHSINQLDPKKIINSLEIDDHIKLALKL